MRLAAAGVLPADLSAVLITHLHSDHITDLNDVITTHWVMTSPDHRCDHRAARHPEVVDAVLARSSDIGYRIAHHDDLTTPLD